MLRHLTDHSILALDINMFNAAGPLISHCLESLGLKTTLWMIGSMYVGGALFALLVNDPSKVAEASEDGATAQTPLVNCESKGGPPKRCNLALLLYLAGRGTWGLAGFVPFYSLPSLILTRGGNFAQQNLNSTEDDVFDTHVTGLERVTVEDTGIVIAAIGQIV